MAGMTKWGGALVIYSDGSNMHHGPGSDVNNAPSRNGSRPILIQFEGRKPGLPSFSISLPDGTRPVFLLRSQIPSGERQYLVGYRRGKSRVYTIVDVQTGAMLQGQTDEDG